MLSIEEQDHLREFIHIFDNFPGIEEMPIDVAMVARVYKDYSDELLVEIKKVLLERQEYKWYSVFHAILRDRQALFFSLN